MRKRTAAALLAACALLLACGPRTPEPGAEGTFTFAVFGDGPYYAWEQGRYRRTLADIERSGAAFLIHVGDFLWYPCTEQAYAQRRAQLDALGTPTVYTPGDNEWTDCHDERPGRFEPLGRLELLRRVFFATPERSLGRDPLPLVTQAADPAYAGFPENARWSYGGFVFATLHVVGSSNGLEPFPGRTAAHDREVARRTAATLAWLDATFAAARADSARGVVLALHAAMAEGEAFEPSPAYAPIVSRLRSHVAAFDGPVLLIHGDNHEVRVDRPLRDSTGQPQDHFTRIETMGSPDIGWLRVVIDTLDPGLVGVEPRRMRGWW